MLDPYEDEILQAKRLVESLGLDVKDFSFAVRSLPPSSETAGMFVLCYDVDVSAKPLQYERSFSGGGGSDWLDEFASDLKHHVRAQR